MKFSVTTHQGYIYESSSLEEIKRISEELKVRRTGRTTKMLLSALGDVEPVILIIGHNKLQSVNLLNQFKDILEKLEFKYEFNKVENSIKNFGKYYLFKSEEWYSNSAFTCSRHKLYKDEK